MKKNIRLRILVTAAFLAAAMLLYVAWNRMQQNVDNLVDSVEMASRPDRNLVSIKELWTSFRSVANNVRAYTVTRDNRYLEEFLDVKDDISITIDSLKAGMAIGGTGAHAFDSLQLLFNNKVRIYEELLEINYNRVLGDALSEMQQNEPVIDTAAFSSPEGNLAQRLFSSRYSRKSLAARADSLIRERNNRLIEYKNNVKRIREEEARLLKLQSEKELALLEADIDATGKIEQLITRLELDEKIRMAGRIEMSNQQAMRSAKLIRDMMIGGVVIILLLFILVLIDLDISDRRKRELLLAQQKAQQLASAREEFIATMSHEIRTPLTSIIGFSEKLSGTPLTQPQQHFMQAITGSSGHLLAIVNDVLDYTRIESGNLKFENISFAVAEVFHDVYQALMWKAGEKNIRFNLFIAPLQQTVLSGDPVRLRQVLFNLCGNAIKFTSKGSVDVTATCSGTGNNVLLQGKVSDTGIGIPAGKLEKIFEQYEQATESTGRVYGGSGLGLAITKKIITQLGGTITVESNAGIGSVFSFSIPYLVGDKENLVSAYSPSAGHSPLQGVKIILAEDDPLIRELNVKMLRDAGAKVLPAADGMEALALLKENEISLMLFDIQMPVLSGPDAVKTIRSEFSGDKQMTPVIAMTANVLQHDLRSYLDAGFNDYITKPFSEKDLLDKIMKLLYPGKSFQGNAFADVEVVPPKVVSKVQTDPGYNLQALIDSARGNKDFVKKMINLFLTSSYASLNNLKFHLNRQNREQLAKTAHRMIGSCKQMGADKVAALLKQLEKETNENEPYDNLQQLVTNIETELQKIFTGLKSEQEKAETETENRPG